LERTTAFEHGRIHAELLRLGRPMQVVDMMIAADLKRLKAEHAANVDPLQTLAG